MKIDMSITAAALAPACERLWEVSGQKLRRMMRQYDLRQGSPVFTVRGRYTARGWTEWTLGFYIGSFLLQFDATGDEEMLRIGRKLIDEHLDTHVTAAGVHDHGFMHISTRGTLWRLIKAGRIDADEGEVRALELALKCSGATQARRWTALSEGGYIYSFNGPHSLFVDTIRSLRALGLAHRLGGVLLGENDKHISLLERLIQHAWTTARYAVYYGEGRDVYDVRGRVAHESIFNVNDGAYRCPNSQQGYSPFTTWTRGLAWALLGFAEQLEFLETCSREELWEVGGAAHIKKWMERAARAVCDYYIEVTPRDGVPYWDTGAPGLAQMGNYLEREAEPFNDHEPVDSSAAAIAAQGLLRLGHYLKNKRYWQAGLTVLKRLLEEPYLSMATQHEGLLLHSVYHRPNGWDYVPPGRRVPCGEASMWGDYHVREAALYVQRCAKGEKYVTFFGEK